MKKGFDAPEEVQPTTWSVLVAQVYALGHVKGSAVGIVQQALSEDETQTTHTLSGRASRMLCRQPRCFPMSVSS